ncbi:flagellar FliJ family protein [Paraferrimonas sp. SM1919]|uniref:flagellar FliJ family protein n=1 Tax=Paraferrimonas sp. SM1919 TaxID=2662263 RepID=UPI0013D4D376|nr:flagellar FliJ family protein [Paraferrimonas sp. SM1919]
MAKTNSLMPVINLLAKQKDQLLLQLRQYNVQISNHQQQIKKIERYRLDYVAQLNEAKSKQQEAHYIQQYYRFIRQLDNATEKEYSSLNNVQSSKQQVTQQYQQIESKLKGLNFIQDKKVLKQKQLLAKQEQNLLDELSLLQVLKR